MNTFSDVYSIILKMEVMWRRILGRSSAMEYNIKLYSQLYRIENKVHFFRVIMIDQTLWLF